MSKIIIQGAGLAKTYQEGPLTTPVFSGIDVQVLAGESLAIVGASGPAAPTISAAAARNCWRRFRRARSLGVVGTICR